mmetsp:Transcript_13472/g.31681  ORF Transcript_13472/g.31681 Transcript_13472/m.31681 type:complete len:215 (+) Transcript_13472:84-728(+)
MLTHGQQVHQQLLQSNRPFPDATKMPHEALLRVCFSTSARSEYPDHRSGSASHVKRGPRDLAMNRSIHNPREWRRSMVPGGSATTNERDFCTLPLDGSEVSAELRKTFLAAGNAATVLKQPLLRGTSTSRETFIAHAAVRRPMIFKPSDNLSVLDADGPNAFSRSPALDRTSASMPNLHKRSHRRRKKPVTDAGPEIRKELAKPAPLPIDPSGK